MAELPFRVCIHTGSEYGAGAAYTIRRIASDPRLYIAYFREHGDERENWLHRDGRTFEDCMATVTAHILQQERVAA